VTEPVGGNRNEPLGTEGIRTEKDTPAHLYFRVIRFTGAEINVRHQGQSVIVGFNSGYESDSSRLCRGYM